MTQSRDPNQKQRGKRPFSRSVSGGTDVEELVSIKTLSEMWEMKERTMREMVNRRTIPFYRIGKLIRFDLHAVRIWLEARRSVPLAPSVVRDEFQ